MAFGAVESYLDNDPGELFRPRRYLIVQTLRSGFPCAAGQYLEAGASSVRARAATRLNEPGAVWFGADSYTPSGSALIHMRGLVRC